MANKLLKKVGGAKTRTLIIFIGGILGIVIISAVLSFSSSESKVQDLSKAAAIPKDIKSVPGEKTNPRYKKIQEEKNKERAEEAAKTGKSSISTIIGNVENNKFGDDDIESSLLKNLRQKSTSSQDDIDKRNKLRMEQYLEEQKRIAAEEDARRRQRQAQLDAERLSQINELEQKRIQSQVSSMNGLANALFKQWTTIPVQAYVSGDNSDANGKNSNAKTVVVNEKGEVIEEKRPSTGKVKIKSGQIIYAVLETGVNTDEKSPILATIVQGPYRGAKLMGSFDHDGKSEKVVLNFDTMTVKDIDYSFGVRAVAIDPDTARTAIASDVDTHFLLRWGSLFASSFMEGYGNAISQQGTTVTQSGGGGGGTNSTGTTTTTKPPLSGKEEFFSALGEVGAQWSEVISENFNIPPTVTVDSGIGIGLLFLSDVDA